MHRQVKLAFVATGILIFGTLFGYLQESITRGNYGDEKFTFALTLVCIEVTFYSIFARVLLAINLKKIWTWMTSFNMNKTIRNEESSVTNTNILGSSAGEISELKKEDKTYKVYYACIAVTYVVAMVSSMKALEWVTYPTQVIAKSAKPIPVMICAVLLSRKSYSIQRYFFVIVIVAGVIVFKIKNGITKSSNDGALFGAGEALLLLSLTMDGFTGAIQERIRDAHRPSALHFMFYINAFASLISIVLVISIKEIFSFISFVQQYPSVIYQSASLALCGAIGQMFIFTMVSSFGSLACTITTTVRKLFSVLCSVIIMGNAFTSSQWIGTSLVFTGLLANAIYGKKSPQHQADADENIAENANEDVELKIQTGRK